MTNTIQETATSYDEDMVQAYINGLLVEMRLEDYAEAVNKEAERQMGRFDELWGAILDELQSPVQNEEGRLGGYTGHRIVTFEGRLGRCALGFHLMHGRDGFKTITAHRRKIYADNRRRRNYTSDELAVDTEEVLRTPNNPQLDYRLGIMGVWLDKFNAAE